MITNIGITFKNNQADHVKYPPTKNKNGGYQAHPYLGVKAGSESTDYAVHIRIKIKLRIM